MMKQLFFALVILSICNPILGQNHWFGIYRDSTAIKQDGTGLIADFQEMITALDTTIDLKNPKMAYGEWGPFYLQPQNTIYLPIWQLSPKEYQDFFEEMGEGKSEGEKMFGLFFNGFYVAHEVAHALQFAAMNLPDNEYDKEYTANILAMLYWREKGKQKELDACYQLAKKAILKMKDPIPEGEDVKAYFTQHYWELAQDPYKYGYIQFSQFIEVYEDGSLPDFDTYVKESMIKK